MDKLMLLEKVNSKNYTHEKLLGWINALAGTSKPGNVPTRFNRGDVLMHPIFQHPYVLIRKLKDGSWVCGLITSEPECTEILEPCKSRFFSDNYFTKVQFTATVPIGRFMGVFGNPKQVKEYGEKLQKLFA